MNQALLLVATILVLCVVFSKVLNRFGTPALLVFLGLGLVFGSGMLGIINLGQDDFAMTQQVCSIALIFIIFCGGFETNWQTAKPTALPSILLASIGVVLTAGLTGVFCHYVLRMEWLHGLLIGSVVASTDAASVFSILRSRNLNLKGGMASLLEMESGSNDPAAYMLTIIMISLIQGGGDVNIPVMIAKQLGFGLGVGAGLALLLSWLLKRGDIQAGGLYSILMIAMALLSYSLAEAFGGNGYMSAYLAGIILGNSGIPGKKSLVTFLDAVSWTMQILLFFTLGLLAEPSRLSAVFVPALLMFLFMLVIGRPATILGLLSWFKIPLKRQLLVSWVGLRGAASIVFAIFAVTALPDLQFDLFHMVFVICLLSVIIQGTLIPQVAKKLDQIDTTESVFKTFTDYEEELPNELLEAEVKPGGKIVGMALKDLPLPDGILVVMLLRGKERIIPNGSTVFQAGDRVVFSAQDSQYLEEMIQKRLQLQVSEETIA